GRVDECDGGGSRPAAGRELRTEIQQAGRAAGSTPAVIIVVSEVAVDESGELGLGERADLSCFDIACLEQHQRRDAADTEACGGVLIVIEVDLGDVGSE